MALDWAKALRQAAKIRSSAHHQWSPDCAAAESSGLSAGGGLPANSLPACPAPWALSPATPSSSTSEGDSAVTVANGCKPFAAAKKLSVSLSAQPSAQLSAQAPSPARRASSRRGRHAAPMQVPPLASPSTGSCSYSGRGGAAAEAASPRSASWVGAAVETPRGASGAPPSFTAVSPLLLPPNAANGAADVPAVHLSSSRKAALSRRAKRPASPPAAAAAASPSAAEVETALNDWLTNVLAPALAAGGAASGNAAAARCSLVAPPPPVAQAGNAPAHVPAHAPVHARAQPLSLPEAHSARGGNDSPEDAFCPLAFLAGDLDECDQVKPQLIPQDVADAKGKLSGDGGMEGCAGLLLSATHDLRGAAQTGGGKCAEEGESLEELAAQDIDWQSLLAPWEPASGGSSGAPDSEVADPVENSSGVAAVGNNGPNDCPSANSQVVATGDGDLAPMWHADVADLCMGVPAWISHEYMDGLHQWDSHSYEEEHLHLAKRQRLV
ncbi:unnamed protein product [Closterium sp. NIES-65]|nr:unnamed protein product [Closterium sp. NIES-65]